MAYERTHWVNDSGPPLSAENLNKMEVGIEEAHAHIANKDNPHDTTPEKIGAASEEDFLLHAGDKDNPHKVKHHQTEPEGAVSGMDETKDKHISDNDYRLWDEHRKSKANPHDVKHDQTGPLGVNLASDNTTRDKHVSDADAKRWEEHINHPSPHIGHETPEGAQAKVNEHALRTDNPHDTTPEKIGAPTIEAFDAHVTNLEVHVTKHQKNALDNTTYPATAENPVVTFVELQEALSGGIRSSVPTLLDLAAIPPEERSSNDLRLVEEKGMLYRFDPRATEGEVKPLEGEGYWSPIFGATPNHNALMNLQGGDANASEYFHLTRTERDIFINHVGLQGNPHNTSAEDLGALTSINGISGIDGNLSIALDGLDLEVEVDAENAKITLINRHNERDDNPHNTKHHQTEPEGAVSGMDETKDKHISDNDYRLWEEHRVEISAHVHGATNDLVAGRIISRDATGRAKVADPIDDEDIVNKRTLDTTIMDALAGALPDSSSTPDPGKWMRRDDAGRSQVEDPAAAKDIVNKQTLDAAVDNLLTTIAAELEAVEIQVSDHESSKGNVHGATHLPIGGELMVRDLQGRTRVEDPVDPKDAVNKQTLDNALANLDLGPKDHSDLTGVQGGNATEQYHLTAEEYFRVTNNGLIKMNGGTNTFAGNGREKSFPHGLGGVPKTVQITPIAPDSSGTGGSVGEIWYRADETTIWVGNTGSSTISFGWFAMR